MPIPRKDMHSGAIIFDPTPEEAEIKRTKADLDQMKAEMAEKLKQLDEVLATTKKRK